MKIGNDPPQPTPKRVEADRMLMRLAMMLHGIPVIMTEVERRELDEWLLQQSIAASRKYLTNPASAESSNQPGFGRKF